MSSKTPTKPLQNGVSWLWVCSEEKALGGGPVGLHQDPTDGKSPGHGVKGSQLPRLAPRPRSVALSLWDSCRKSKQRARAVPHVPLPTSAVTQGGQREGPGECWQPGGRRWAFIWERGFNRCGVSNVCKATRSASMLGD